MIRRVLITGGMGYVGGRVAQSVEGAGYSVRIASRYPGGAPDWLPSAELVGVDWSSPETLRLACAGVDTVVHLAAMNEIDSVRDPEGALLANGLNSLSLLEAAIQGGARRFVYMSTAHVYGAPLQGVIDERRLPRAQHPYAITHKVAEDFVLAAHDQSRIEGVVLRLSNGFGVPAHAGVDRWSLIVNDLCRQAVAGDHLQLKSTGLQKRDFITLGDVGRAVVHCLNLSREMLGDGLFNLGGERVLRIVDMAQRVQERWAVLSGKHLPIRRPEVSEQERLSDAMVPSLVFSSAKLLATGFSLTSEFDREIDETLRLCSHAFSGQV